MIPDNSRYDLVAHKSITDEFLRMLVIGARNLHRECVMLGDATKE